MSRLSAIAHTLQEPSYMYDDLVKSTFSNVQSIGSVVRDVATLAAMPVAYPVTLALYAIGRAISPCAGHSEPYQKGHELKEYIDRMAAGALPGWQELAVKKIRQARFESHNSELERLRGAGILTPAREAKISSSIMGVMGAQSLFVNTQAKVLYGQAFEIKKVYQKTDHVFLHAQAIQWMVYFMLLKEFVRTFQPEVTLHDFKFLRIPTDNGSGGFLSSLWNFIWGTGGYSSVQSYLRSKWWTIHDDDPKTREEILSADAYFYNNSSFESSMFFLTKNSNIMVKPDTILHFSKKVIEHFHPKIDKPTLSKLSAKINRVAKLATSTSTGNLFAICLPKKESHNIQYRAHPYGKPCTCHPFSDSRKILDDLQNEKLDAGNKCSMFMGPAVPQFRIYTPLLRPEKGVKIHLLSPLAKNVRRQMKGELNAIAKDVHSRKFQRVA